MEAFRKEILDNLQHARMALNVPTNSSGSESEWADMTPYIWTSGVTPHDMVEVVCAGVQLALSDLKELKDSEYFGGEGKVEDVVNDCKYELGQLKQKLEFLLALLP